MRSTRADVRNPLLQLESARRLAEWLEASTARRLYFFLSDISKDARERAQQCWKKHKAPMALYWKVVAVYARHLAQICRGIESQAIADGAPGRILELERSLRELLPIAEAYLDAAPAHPDNAKLETARALLR